MADALSDEDMDRLLRAFTPQDLVAGRVLSALAEAGITVKDAGLADALVWVAEWVRRAQAPFRLMTEAEWRRTFKHWPHPFRAGADGWCLECGEGEKHGYHHERSE